MKIRAALCLSPLLLALIFAAACGAGNGAKPEKSPTAEPTGPADANAIHDIDFGQVAALKTLAAQSGGQIDAQSALYADLTKDGRDEAIVPITSGGTLGNVAYLVLTMRSGAPVPILTATRDRSSPGGVFMTVEDGKLVKTLGKYGPEDPLCCPSELVKTTYRWDGSSLQVEREEQMKAGGGKQ
jgi:hypothetical protein